MSKEKEEIPIAAPANKPNPHNKPIKPHEIELEYHNPLSILADNGMLFYNNEGTGGKHKKQAIKDLIISFNDEYKTDISREFVNLITSRLVETKYTDPSFEGLVLLKSPNVIDGYRAECYDHESQQVSVCTTKDAKIGNGFCGLPTTFGRLLVHEFTHAIDDNINEYVAAKGILSYLAKNTDKIDRNGIEKIMTVAGNFLDPIDFKDLYITPFFEGIDKQLKQDSSLNIKQVLTKINDGLEPSSMPESKDIVLIEYTSFHSEKLLPFLSNNSQKLASSLNTDPKGYLSALNEFMSANKTSDDIKIHALEILKISNEPFIKVLLEFPKNRIESKLLKTFKETNCSEELQVFLKNIIPGIEQIQQSLGKTATLQQEVALSPVIDKDEWFSDNKMHKVLQKISPQGVEIKHAAAFNINTIQDSLKNLEDGKKYIIPLNIYPINKGLLGSEQENPNAASHWAGLYIDKSNKEIGVTYIDPLGGSINKDLAQSLRDNLQLKIIKEPLKETSIQYNLISKQGNVEFLDEQSNKNDCGPFTIYLLATLAHGNELPKRSARSLEESKSWGLELRKELAKDGSNFQSLYNTMNQQFAENPILEKKTTDIEKPSAKRKLSDEEISSNKVPRIFSSSAVLKQKEVFNRNQNLPVTQIAATKNLETEKNKSSPTKKDSTRNL